MIGDWLEDCGFGWKLLFKLRLHLAADSFVKVSHVTRARHAHQVSASSFHLLKKSYTQYIKSLESGIQPEEFEKWCGRRKQESPHFRLWYTALQLELDYKRVLILANIGDLVISAKFCARY